MAIFWDSHQIASDEIDRSYRLKYSVILHLFQNVSFHASEAYGFGSEDIGRNGYNWIILRTYVEIYRLPTHREEIFVGTYHTPLRKFIYPRQYIIKNKDGEILVKGIIYWAMMSKESHHLVLPSVSKVQYEGFSEPGELIMPEALKITNELPFSHSEVVRYSDLDLNGHLNNISYFSFLLNSHSLEHYEKKEIKAFQLDYINEGKEGDNIDVFSDNDCPENFILKIKDKNILFGKLVYRND